MSVEIASPGLRSPTGHWGAYVLVSFGISWVIWAPAVLATLGVLPPPLPLDVFTPISIFVGAFGPLTAALLLSGGRRNGDGGRAKLLRRGVQWRTIGLPSVAVMFGLPIVISFVARMLDAATGGTPPGLSVANPLVLIPLFVVILVLGGPVQEEFGWRGYALPRLLQRFGMVPAPLILSLLWTVWHLPFWFMEGSGMEGTPFPIFLLYMVGLTAVMTWLHLNTAGSVLAAILMHTTANWVSNFLPTHGPEVLESNAYLFQAIGYVLVGALLLRVATRTENHS